MDESLRRAAAQKLKELLQAPEEIGGQKEREMERTRDIEAEGVGEGARQEMDFDQQSHWEDKRECERQVSTFRGGEQRAWEGNVGALNPGAVSEVCPKEHRVEIHG